MRRALYLLAALMFGAAAPARAQARAITVAHLGPRNDAVLVHVSNLLDDPEWVEAWRNAYFIQVHWTVQLWRKANFLFKTQQQSVEWDVVVYQVPQMDLFTFMERLPNGRTTTTSFRTLDSLKEYLTQDERIPRPGGLPSGSYYYRIDAELVASEKNPLETSTPSDAGFGQKFIGLFTGSTLSRALGTVERPFTVP